MSAVWKYFKISAEDNSKAKCSLCGAMLSWGGKNLKTYGTSTLLKHLLLKHSENSESNVSTDSDNVIVKKQKIDTFSVNTVYIMYFS